MTKLLLYLISSCYLSVCFSAFQCPSPHYPGATIRLRSSAVSFSTWSVQRSLAEPFILEEGTEVSLRRRGKGKGGSSCWSLCGCAHPVWICSAVLESRDLVEVASVLLQGLSHLLSTPVTSDIGSHGLGIAVPVLSSDATPMLGLYDFCVFQPQSRIFLSKILSA